MMPVLNTVTSPLLLVGILLGVVLGFILNPWVAVVVLLATSLYVVRDLLQKTNRSRRSSQSYSDAV